MNQHEGETPIAIAVVRRGNLFLVGERGPAGPLPGHAEFSGGKCLPAETAEECVVREVREETGLEVKVLRLRREVRHDYPHGRLRLLFFDCAPITEAEPASPFRWVRREDLARLSFPEANRAVIAELLQEGDSG